MAWRVCIGGTGVFILLGGPRHPGGTMAEMLAHPDWVLSHALVLAGFLALLAGLWLFGRREALSAPVRRWTRLAAIGTALQAVEMVVHTASVVDYQNLVAGASTPVLTTHLVLAVILYPVFGATLTGFIVVAARERALGSLWISWLGVLGAVAHGLAAPLVVALGLQWARVLFPMLMLVAFWTILAALWPLPARSVEPAPA